jgi:hypothetical protein
MEGIHEAKSTHTHKRKHGKEPAEHPQKHAKESGPPVAKQAKPTAESTLPKFEQVEFDDEKATKAVKVFVSKYKDTTGWLTNPKIPLEYAMREQQQGPPRVGLPNDVHIVLPPCIMASFSKLSRYGTYNIENDPTMEYAPADVVSSKYNVILLPESKRVVCNSLHADYAANYANVRALIEHTDKTYFDAVCDPVNARPTDNKDHEVVCELEMAKKETDYDKVAYSQSLANIAHAPRKKGQKTFPTSNIRRRIGKTKVVDGVKVCETSETIAFTRNCFRNLYKKELTAAQGQTQAAREALLPERFRGLPFTSPQTAKHPNLETKSIYNTAFSELPITDIRGRTPEAFMSQFAPGHKIDLRECLADLKVDIPVSLTVVLRAAGKNSRQTFNNNLDLVNIMLPFTWGYLHSLSLRRETTREGFDEDDAMQYGLDLDDMDGIVRKVVPEDPEVHGSQTTEEDSDGEEKDKSGGSQGSYDPAD